MKKSFIICLFYGVGVIALMANLAEARDYRSDNNSYKNYSSVHYYYPGIERKNWSELSANEREVLLRHDNAEWRNMTIPNRQTAAAGLSGRWDSMSRKDREMMYRDATEYGMDPTEDITSGTVNSGNSGN